MKWDDGVPPHDHRIVLHDPWASILLALQLLALLGLPLAMGIYYLYGAIT